MKICFIGEVLSKILVRTDGFSLDVSVNIEWVSFDISGDGAKYLLSFGRSGSILDDKTLRSKYVIWLGLSLGTDNGPSLGNYWGG